MSLIEWLIKIPLEDKTHFPFDMLCNTIEIEMTLSLFSILLRNYLLLAIAIIHTMDVARKFLQISKINIQCYICSLNKDSHILMPFQLLRLFRKEAIICKCSQAFYHNFCHSVLMNIMCTVIDAFHHVITPVVRPFQALTVILCSYCCSTLLELAGKYNSRCRM